MKPQHLTAALALLGLLVAGDRSASACPSGCTCSGSSSNLVNHNGDILAFSKLWVVYWGWGSGNTAHKQSVEAVLNCPLVGYGLGGSRWWNLMTQYPDTDREFGGTYSPTNETCPDLEEVVDTHNVPTGGSVSESQEQTEVDYLAANVISVSPDEPIIMMLPPGNTQPLAGACGRHLVTPNRNLAIWVAFPDTTSNCAATPTDAEMERSISHEFLESITDPNWVYTTLGWSQGSGAGCEIGDLCEGNWFSLQAQPSSAAVSDISEQQYWSNEAAACVYSRATTAFMFALGTDNNLYAQQANATSSLTLDSFWAWGSPSGVTLAGDPAAASWGQQRLDVFITGHASGVTAMYHAASPNTGAGIVWEALPGTGLPTGESFYGRPGAVSWGAGDLQVWTMVTDTYGDHLLNWKSFDAGGNWTGWSQMHPPSGVSYSSSIAVGSAMATAIDNVFPTDVQTVSLAFYDTAGDLNLGNYDNSTGVLDWTARVKLQSSGSNIVLSGDPIIAIPEPGRVDIFVSDGRYYYDCTSYDGTSMGSGHVTSGNVACSTWGNPGLLKYFSSSPGAVGLGDGRLFAGGIVGGTGGDGYDDFLDFSSGTGWTANSGNFNSAMAFAAY